MANTQFLDAVLGQERRELAGVEMVGVIGDRLVLGRGDHFRRQPRFAELFLRTDRVAEISPLIVAQPVRHQIHLRKALRQHERMVVVIVVGAGGPAGELRALLEGGIAVAEEFGF